MGKLPLVEGILNYVNEKNIRFCMPGHKAGNGFNSTAIGREFTKNLIDIDITEVDGVDNLHNPSGIIKESIDCLSRFYGSQRSYFLVNGSTSGNLTMIFSNFNEGDKIIVERNCHKSIFNGIIIRKLNPVYIKNKISSKYNAPLSLDEEYFLKILDENLDAKGIILTYPNYYGICPNLKFIVAQAKKRNMKILVDSAHGAHFGVCDRLPENAVKLGADMVVMSSHKTLPSFTQTAYLHIGKDIDKERVEFYLNTFLSTSPSYMLMCSMDYARYYLEEKGKKDYLNLIKLCKVYREKINSLEGFYILGKEDLTDEQSELDLTRYIVNLEKGYSGEKLLNYLRKNKIQAEMNDSQNVVLIFSPFNTSDEFEKLYEILKSCPINELKGTYYSILNHNIPKKVLKPYEVINKKKYVVSLKDAEGCICGENIVPYPPGIPIVTLGEVIDKSVIIAINNYLNNGIEVMGLKKINDKYIIKIVKNNYNENIYR